MSGIGKESVFLALVCFERTECETDVLPDDAQGACGWIAIAAEDEDKAYDNARLGMESIGLKLVEFSKAQIVVSADEIDDEHLAMNVRHWEGGKQWVWGTIHIYIADGEA